MQPVIKRSFTPLELGILAVTCVFGAFYLWYAGFVLSSTPTFFDRLATTHKLKKVQVLGNRNVYRASWLLDANGRFPHTLAMITTGDRTSPKRIHVFMGTPDEANVTDGLPIATAKLSSIGAYALAAHVNGIYLMGIESSTGDSFQVNAPTEVLVQAISGTNPVTKDRYGEQCVAGGRYFVSYSEKSILIRDLLGKSDSHISIIASTLGEKGNHKFNVKNIACDPLSDQIYVYPKASYAPRPPDSTMFFGRQTCIFRSVY
jgi:hypothetical protein